MTFEILCRTRPPFPNCYMKDGHWFIDLGPSDLPALKQAAQCVVTIAAGKISLNADI